MTTDQINNMEAIDTLIRLLQVEISLFMIGSIQQNVKHKYS